MKICSKCKQELDESQFRKNNSKKDKLDIYCKNCIRIIDSNSYYRNREKKLKKQKEYVQKNIEKNKKYHQEYYQTNKQNKLKQMKLYNQLHRKERNEYFRNKRKNDINYKLSNNLQKRIWRALITKNKSHHTVDLLGCSIEFLKQYLESQFDEKMNWQNYGSYWEIDHIKQCCTFDLSKEENQKVCFNYTNLRPLEIYKNRSKKFNII